MKVYFAGMEQGSFALIAKIAGVRYLLLSPLYFLAETVLPSLDVFKPPDKAHPLLNFIQDNSNNSIMDSGLFSLMFGAHSGHRSNDFFHQWQLAYIDFVKKYKYKKTLVEVDCQKFSGVGFAWKLREELKSKIKNQIINVYHFEDGKVGLERMIEFSDYIAISVPEVRLMGVGDIANYIFRQCNFIKSKKPEIKIHLLGCTQKTILDISAKVADSCDSTSWQKVNRYGRLSYFKLGNMQNIKRSALEKYAIPKYQKIIEKEFEIAQIKKVGGTHYYCNYLVAMKNLRAYYQSICGSQE